jgi:hypothetical protein
MLRSLFHELEVTTLDGTALYAVEYDPSNRWLLSVDGVTNVSLLVWPTATEPFYLWFSINVDRNSLNRSSSSNELASASLRLVWANPPWS